MIKIIKRRKVNYNLQIMDVKIVHPILIFTPRKLKHLVLKEVHYQLINTCLIISSVALRYCNCWGFSGCKSDQVIQTYVTIKITVIYVKLRRHLT